MVPFGTLAWLLGAAFIFSASILHLFMPFRYFKRSVITFKVKLPLKLILKEIFGITKN